MTGQYLTCNVFNTSYNPGAGFVFLLSHPQHVVIDQHYIAGDFNKSIPNLEEKKHQTSKITLSGKLTKLGKGHKSASESKHLISLGDHNSKTVLILLIKLNGLKTKDQEKRSAMDFKEKGFLFTDLKVIF